MANLISPQISVAFSELGVSAIARGDKGVVALIVRDAAAVAPVILTQATQTPTELGTENQAYVKRAFIGYVNPAKKVILYVIGEEDDLTDALDYMATQEFDYICGPMDCTADEAAEIASWVISQRDANDAKYKAVLPNYNADKYPIINFTTESLQVGSSTYDTAAYCSRIAGLLAGTPLKISATYAPLPEVTDVTRSTRKERDAAVSAGEFFAYWDGRKVKMNRAVNSLVTTIAGMLDSFKKIKIVEVMDLIRTDVTSTIEDTYIGKHDNDYDEKLQLITAIRGYFMGLEKDKLVNKGWAVEIDVDAQEAYLVSKGTDTSEMDEQAIKEADTGSHVFIKIKCKIKDAIEDVIINIAI